MEQELQISTTHESHDKDFPRAWFDPDTHGYRFYLPNGEEIKPCMDCSVTIEDNWGKNYPSFARATINVLVKIVNERP